MKYTIEYIPLDEIKSNQSPIAATKLKNLQNLMYDCMHVLVVKKVKKSGGYQLLCGHSRLNFIVKHTNLKHVPCIIFNERKSSFKKIMKKASFGFGNDVSRKIIFHFINEEPRFKHLTIKQKAMVLLVGLRYKKTLKSSMKKKVDDYLI